MNTETQVEILLIEDKRSDADLTIRALRKHRIGNHIVHLKDGKEALDFLFGRGEYEGRDTSLTPKVILLDLKMPKVGGLEVLKSIKESERLRHIPVVILTSSRESPDIDASYALGANSYIVKPVAFDDFAKAVSELGFYWVLLNQPPL
jgi:two-component system response regulator